MTEWTPPTKADKCKWASAALDAYGAHTGQNGYDYSDPELLAEIAGDLLADLFHLAAAADLAPEAISHNGWLHYSAEEHDE